VTAAATPGEQAWAAALDDFAGRLAAQRAALTDGTVDQLPDFEPPSGLGPLPASLEQRARELLADNEAVTAALAAAAGRAGRELAALSRMTPDDTRPAPAAFVDRRA
jgi:hypothetical protein